MRTRDFFIRFFGYFDFTKAWRKDKQPHEQDERLDAGSKTNLRLMHGTNRLSIFMFLVCLIILFYKLVIK